MWDKCMNGSGYRLRTKRAVRTALYICVGCSLGVGGGAAIRIWNSALT